ncbi:glycosyltransferase family 2 protein [Rubeoparvulum massiliense]|uniref:glycosyltransferase family 2 protein n=1 Tax=Rubeoparvulum massiliense TaxID=1631346 RepID=UPI00065E630A|nr:glycosyltransferase family 2 protein [Rubeoparvulum massiliense]
MEKARVSVIIPAYNEATRIGTTLQALWSTPFFAELIVVDDGSEDHTSEIAIPLATRVIRLPGRCGKGAALYRGWQEAQGEYLLFLDADLGESSHHARHLLPPLFRDRADVTIAQFPSAQKKGGFGLVKMLAREGVFMLTGSYVTSVLSGQRAYKKEVLTVLGEPVQRFGVEVGMTIDCLRKGYRIEEIPLPFQHRETLRNWDGFKHRGKQFIQIGSTLIRKAKG